MTSTDDASAISVEVAYALPDTQRLISLHVPAGTTARAALALSGLSEEFPELDISRCPIGVFGREKDDNYVLRPGDRVEIYRPLLHEPRETRRQLAARGRTMGSLKNSKDGD